MPAALGTFFDALSTFCEKSFPLLFSRRKKKEEKSASTKNGLKEREKVKR
jgi:hypothetical protein